MGQPEEAPEAVGAWTYLLKVVAALFSQIYHIMGTRSYDSLLQEHARACQFFTICKVYYTCGVLIFWMSFS
jgi:hypothetical protein